MGGNERLYYNILVAVYEYGNGGFLHQAAVSMAGGVWQVTMTITTMMTTTVEIALSSIRSVSFFRRMAAELIDDEVSDGYIIPRCKGVGIIMTLVDSCAFAMISKDFLSSLAVRLPNLIFLVEYPSTLGRMIPDD